MKRMLPLLPILFCATILAAQSAAPISSATAEPAVAGLASQLATRLRTARANRILVLDPRGPQDEVHPAGKWLADQLVLALQSSSTDFVLIDRAQINEQSLAAAAPQRKPNESDSFMALARSLGADTVIRGTYAKFSQHLGISLTATNPDRFGPFATVNAVLPINDTLPISAELAALSPDPIPTFRDGILKGGVAATPNPVCVHCPDPEYTDEARRAKLQGIVVLQVTINPQGRVVNAEVIKGPGYGLIQKSLDAVRKWQFKPPVDPEGNPASVSVAVEVSFRLLRGPH
jgi:TonB family protein